MVLKPEQSWPRGVQTQTLQWCLPYDYDLNTDIKRPQVPYSSATRIRAIKKIHGYLGTGHIDLDMQTTGLYAQVATPRWTQSITRELHFCRATRYNVLE